MKDASRKSCLRWPQSTRATIYGRLWRRSSCEVDVTTRLSDLAISDSGFVFDPFSGGTFTLNETGRAVLNGLREGLSESKIVERLRLEFNAVTPKVEEDVRDFVRTISEFGLSE